MYMCRGEISYLYRHCVGVVIVVAALLTMSATAHAGDGDEWYGWQIMPFDAAAIGLTVYDMNDGWETSAGAAGFASYALGGPIVHLAHGQWWESAGSLGLRVGLPLTGVMIASALNPSTGNSQADLAGLGDGITAAAVGVIAAVAIDYIFLARKSTLKSSDASSQAQMLQLQWSF